MLNRKILWLVKGLLLTRLIGPVSAAVSQNGSQVYIQPDASSGYATLQSFSLFSWLIKLLDVVNYLVYVAAIIVILYCVLLVIVSIVHGKRNPQAIKDELTGQAGIIKVVKTIVYMKLALIGVDFIFYIT